MRDKELKKTLGTITEGLILGWNSEENMFIVYKAKMTWFPSIHRTVGKGKTIYAAVRAYQKQTEVSKPG